MSRSAINAGVIATTGFGLQKNIAIFTILEDYHLFKNRKYSIFMEHHDDVVFCFFTSDDKIEELKAYQSKKNHKDWTINKDLAEIIVKLLETGENLEKDNSIDKIKNCPKNLIFASNRAIKLSSGSKKGLSKKINEECVKCSYESLPDKIKEKIITTLNNSSLHNKLKHLNFFYIDLPAEIERQKKTLSGMLEDLFGKEITDHRAAIDTIIQLLGKVETTYNQNREAKLVDKTKQVTHKEIENVFNLCKSKAKAFDYWRRQDTRISTELKILPNKKDQFEDNFRNAFDFFKSKEQAEHLKILDFVKENYTQYEDYEEIKSVQRLFNAFKEYKSSSLEDLILKAIIYAAYFEVTYKKEA